MYVLKVLNKSQDLFVIPNCLNFNNPNKEIESMKRAVYSGK